MRSETGLNDEDHDSSSDRDCKRHFQQVSAVAPRRSAEQTAKLSAKREGQCSDAAATTIARLAIRETPATSTANGSETTSAEITGWTRALSTW